MSMTLRTLVLFALAVHTPVFAQGSPNPDAEAVRQVVLDIAEQLQAGNLDAVQAHFATRGHILTDNATTHGFSEYRDGYLRPELARFEDLQYTHSSIETVVRGDVAWAAFRRELSNGGPSGQAPEQGRATAILEKADGRWLIVHLHVSH